MTTKKKLTLEELTSIEGWEGVLAGHYGTVRTDDGVVFSQRKLIEQGAFDLLLETPEHHEVAYYLFSDCYEEHPEWLERPDVPLWFHVRTYGQSLTTGWKCQKKHPLRVIMARGDLDDICKAVSLLQIHESNSFIQSAYPILREDLLLSQRPSFHRLLFLARYISVATPEDRATIIRLLKESEAYLTREEFLMVAVPEWEPITFELSARVRELLIFDGVTCDWLVNIPGSFWVNMLARGRPRDAHRPLNTREKGILFLVLYQSRGDEQVATRNVYHYLCMILSYKERETLFILATLELVSSDILWLLKGYL